MNRLLAALIPFFILGMVIVAFVFGLILFSYLLIFGAIVGLVLFVIGWIRQKFFPSKHLTTRSKKTGRTFEHDDQDH